MAESEHICNGKPCPYPLEMKEWLKKSVNHDGSYPDPIDNSPCDHCSKNISKICEHCGKEIIYPNYIVSSFKGMFESFYECAICDLEFHIDQYNEFKEEFPLDSDFHITELTKINQLIKSLQR